MTDYDNAGRLSSVRNAFTSTTYAGSAGYAPNGAMSSLTLETGNTETTTFNSRFQPTQIQAGMMTLGYGYGITNNGTSNNNGNVQSAAVTWSGSGTLRYMSELSYRVPFFAAIGAGIRRALSSDASKSPDPRRSGLSSAE